MPSWLMPAGLGVLAMGAAATAAGKKAGWNREPNHADLAPQFRIGSRVRVLRAFEELEEIRDIWSDWAETPDADFDVFRTVLECGSDPAQPRVMVVERCGNPDAIWIASLSTTTLNEKIAYLNVPMPRVRLLNSVYGGFLGNQSRENSELIAQELRQSLNRGEADVTVFRYLREDAPLHAVITNTRSSLIRDHFRATHSHSFMALPDRAEAIYAGLSKEHRWKLRRDARRFREAFAHLTVVRFDSTHRLQEMFQDAEAIAATTYQRGLGVGFSDTRPIRELLRLEAEKGWLRGYILYAGGRPCAFWIGCVYGGKFLSEYLGHDPAYAKHSPGNYILTSAMEDLCREGVKAIDFGFGEAQYKQRFGTDHRHERTIYVYAPTWPGIRARAARTTAMLINSAGKAVLRRANLGGRIKKMWRQRVAHPSS